MDGHIVLSTRELGDGAAAGDDRERRHAGDRKRLDVIAAEKHDHVRLGLVEDLAKLPHAGRGRVELLRILIRRTREQVRRVTRADGRNDFTHGYAPYCLPSLQLVIA